VTIHLCALAFTLACWSLLVWVHSLPAEMSLLVVRYAGPDVEKIMGAYREGLTAQREMLVIAVCFPPRLRMIHVSEC